MTAVSPSIALQGVDSPYLLPAWAIQETLFSIFRNEIYRGMYPRMWMAESGGDLGLTATRFIETYPAWDRAIRTLPDRSFRALLVELTTNITLSMLAEPTLVYLQNNTVSAQVVSKGPVWMYDKRPLLGAYGTALLCGFLGLVIGIKAILANGVSMTVGFLSIVATTRNPSLDEATRGHCLGVEAEMDDIKDIKVKFGELRQMGDGDEVGMRRRAVQPHAAFGFEGEVAKLRKDVTYL
jgi:hypothetical protein